MGRELRTYVARAAVLVTGLAVLGSPVVAPAEAARGGVPEGPHTSPAGPARAITLITGDKIIVRGKELNVRPGPGRAGIAFHRSVRGGHRFVIPSDALALVGQGRVDRRLFDISQLLRWRYDDERRNDIPVMVERAAGTRTAAVPGVKVSATLPTLGVDAASVPKNAATRAWQALVKSGVQGSAAGGAITRIWLDGRRKALLDRSTKQIGAPVAWRKGLTGKGVRVAVLDTGADRTHPDLRGVITQARGFTSGGPGDTKDEVGHGTHVASIVAGSGAASKGRYRGVAPGAKVIVGKVLDDGGLGMDSWILAGMEWAVTTGRAKIVNLSLGGADTPEIDPLERAVNTLSARTGALFAIAAGNEGGTQTVGSPGSADAALTVGAVDRGDRLAGFSSRGPRTGDNAIKPDVTAPGVGIVAARAAGVPADRPVGARYLRADGTSMATPHVAGAAAILAQQHPRWPGARIKAALIGSAKPAPRTPATAQGSGRIDLARAVSGPVTAEPGSRSAYLRWPQKAPVARTVTYTNDSGRPVRLRLALQIDQPKGRAAFRLGTTMLNVPARGRATVRLTLLGRGVAPGTYSGVIAATGPGVSVRTVVGAYVEPRSHDLTISAVDAAGRPANGLLILLDRKSQREIWINRKAKVRVPDGDYRLYGSVEGTGRCAPMMLLTRPVKVGRDLTVVADIRKGKQVHAAVDEPTAVRDPSYDVNFAYRGEYSFGIGGECAAEVVRVLPTKQSGLSYYSHTSWRKDSAEPVPSPYRYEVYDYRLGGLPANPSYTARTAGMAVLKSTFRGQGVAGKALPWLTAEVPLFNGYTSWTEERPVPSELTYYLTANERFRWHQALEYGEEPPDLPVLSGRIAMPPKVFTKGTTYQQTWNAAVVGPGVTGYGLFGIPFGMRSGNELGIGPSGVFGDGAPGRYGYDLKATGTMTLARNGQIIKRASFKEGGLQATVPAAAATYTVTSSGTRDVPYSTLSTRVDAEWRFRSARTSRTVSLPVRSVGFAPRGLDGLNRAPAGSLTTLPIWVSANQGTGPVRVRTLKVWASTDDGGTWAPLTLTRAGGGWTGTVSNPAAGFVSLKAQLVDESGNSVKQTVIRAYAIGG